MDHFVIYKRGFLSQTVGWEKKVDSPEDEEAHGEANQECQVVQAHPTNPLACRIRVDSGNQAS